MRLIAITVCVFCLLFDQAPANALDAPPDNANIIRQTTGVLAFRALGTGKVRGEERFHISVHPDGSRTVSAISRYGPRDIQRHSLYRIDAALRPIDATLQYWIEGQWRASGLITVDGDAVTATSRNPSGTASHTVTIAEPFAVLPHQLTPDSLRVLLYDKGIGGRQTFAMYSPDPLAEGDQGLLGEVTAQEITYEGDATLTVPAGTFAVEHYRAGDAIDIYVTGPDAVLVKWSFHRIDREHVLISVDGLD